LEVPIVIRVTVLYGHPSDPEAFESYYAETHLRVKVPLMPNVSRVDLAKVIGAPEGATPQYYRIADLWFDNMAAFQESFQSEGTQAAVKDLENFATGGVTVLISETSDSQPQVPSLGRERERQKDQLS
jgi:uncharacterized protein (TIGR02118 family)